MLGEEEIRGKLARAEAAMPGPWFVGEGGERGLILCRDEEQLPLPWVVAEAYGDCGWDKDYQLDNAEFIASARQDVEELARDLLLANNLLADLCNDSLAASTAMKFRAVLEEISSFTLPDMTDHWDVINVLTSIRHIAYEAIHSGTTAAR